MKRKYRMATLGFVLTLGTILVSFFMLYYNMAFMEPYCENYINSLPVMGNPEKSKYSIAHDETGSYAQFKMKNKKDGFKVLQLTDIHIGGGKNSIEQDKKAIMTVYNVVTEANPDLIIITGDLVYCHPTKAFNLDNYCAMKAVVHLMDKFGIPWSFTFGNHEQEAFNTTKRSRLKEVIYGSAFGISEFVSGIDGDTNQYIELLNIDGSVNQELFLLDSNAYIESGYDGIHRNQLDWYASVLEKKAICDKLPKDTYYKSLMFFHIPIVEFKYALDAYRNNDQTIIDDYNIEWYYGNCLEKNYTVSMSSTNLGTFMYAKKYGCQGIFVGHDHLNDYSVSYDGIRLTFGQTIDYLAYADDNYPYRGGTLITINSDSSFDVEQIIRDYRY